MIDLPPDLQLGQPSIVLMTGPSGSGKSQAAPLILGAMGFDPPHRPAPARPDLPLIDAVADDPMEAVRRLSSVGLGDPFTWCRVWSELSLGQKHRLDLLAAIYGPSDCLFVDEWLAHLDRVTARAVAWATGRVLRRAGKSALLITSHDDLVHDLQPDVHIRLGWTPAPAVIHRTGDLVQCSVVQECHYDRGHRGHWKALSHLHYAAGDPATTHSYHVLLHPQLDHPAAVAVYSFPDLHSAARNAATGDDYKLAGSRQQAQRLNRDVLKLSRIVVTPELRGIGLASDLIQRSASTLGVKWVECSTAMGRYSNFLARCGFHEVPQGTAQSEAELQDWAVQAGVPDHAALDGNALAEWIDGQSVRQARRGRQLVWRHYHHFVLHRRTRTRPAARVPNPGNPHWPEAYDVAARRLHERPSYWILGPIDPMTGIAEEADVSPAEAP